MNLSPTLDISSDRPRHADNVSRKILVIDPVGGDAHFLESYIRAKGGTPIVPEDTASWQSVAGDCDGMIVNLAKIDREAISRAPHCRVIARLGIGTDNVDVEAATASGIRVTNVPDYCTVEVAEHCLGLIVASVRKIGQADHDMRAGIWTQLGYRPIRQFSQLVLGLVGFGKLAHAVAERAGTLGFRVIASDPFAEESDLAELVPFERLLAEADIISLHAPSTPSTRQIINQASLALCEKRPIIVNTARGDLIDETALAEALDAGLVSGAALDVFSEEPLPAVSCLRGRANVTLTPHMAFYSEQSLEDLQRQAADDVLAVLSGEPPRNPVN